MVIYAPVVFLGKTLQPPLYYPHGVTERGPYGYEGRKSANTFDIDLATPAYYEWPINRLVGKMYRQGQIPLWNPYQASGTPLAVQYNTRVFFPYQILENICPAWTWDYFLLGRLWIAGFFTYLFLALLGLSLAGAFLGGLFYMLSGTLVWFINLEQMANVAMVVPVLLFYLERLARNRNARDIALSALAFALVLLAGQPEVALYVFLLGAAYYLFRIWERKGDCHARLRQARNDKKRGFLEEKSILLRKIFHLASAFGLGLGLAAILLVPFLEHLNYSYHIHPLGGKMGVDNPPPWHWAISLVVPSFFEIPADADYADLPFSRLQDSSGKWSYYRMFPTNGRWDFLGGYCGMLPIYLILLGLIIGFLQGSGKERRYLLFFAGFGLFIVLKNFGVIPFNWLGYLPLFDQAWSQRWAGPVWTFSFAVAGAFGWEIMRDGLKNPVMVDQLKEGISKQLLGLTKVFSWPVLKEFLLKPWERIRGYCWHPVILVETILFVAIDIILAIKLYQLAWLVRGRSTLFFFTAPLPPQTTFEGLSHYYLVIALSQVVFLGLFGLYRVENKSFGRILVSVSTALLLQMFLLTGYYSIQVGFVRYPSSIFPVFWAFNTLLVSAYRLLARELLRMFFSEESYPWPAITKSRRGAFREIVEQFRVSMKGSWGIIILIGLLGMAFLIHIRYLLLFYNRLGFQQRPYFWSSMILGEVVALIVLLLAIWITWLYTKKEKGIYGLIALGIVELWYAVPRGYSSQWMYLELIPLLIGFFTVWACTRELWRLVAIGGLVAVFSFITIDLMAPYGFPERYDPFKEAPYVDYLKRQEGHYRVVSGYGLLMPNYASALEIPTVQYIDALAVAWYHRYRVDNLHTDRLFEESSDILWFTGRPELHIDNDGRGELFYRWIEEDIKAKLPFYSLLGVKYILVPREVDVNLRPNPLGYMKDPVYFPLVYQNDIRIYENRYSLPRVFIAHQIEYAATYKEAQKAISRKRFDLKNRVVLEESGPEGIGATPSAPMKDDSKVTILEYKPSNVVIEAQVDNPGVLVLSDTYYPGWKAEIDGIPTKVYRVDGLIRGVFVDQGKHRVVFYYWPRSFIVGVGLASISGLICLFLLAFPARHPKNSPLLKGD